MFHPRASIGIVWGSALALLGATNAWLICGYFGPLRDRPDPVFVLATPPWWHLPLWWAAALALVAGTARPLDRWRQARGRGVPRARWARLASIVLLSMPLAAIVALRSPLTHFAAPWVYFFVDLQPWVLAGAALLLAADINGEVGKPFSGRVTALWERFTARTSSQAWLDTALVVTLAVASLATSPLFRFQSAVIGDEPKYVRYLENWFRGRGMDVTSLAPIGELPPDHGSAVFRNLGHVGRAAAGVVSDAVQDLRRLAGLAAEPRPGPARGAGGWFVQGKRGGVYQVHTPGLSFLLFPGYVIDRTFLNWTSEFHPQLPTNLYCTATLVLILYLAWGLAVFRLLAAYTNRRGLSWALAALVMMALPSSAFAYQYYPEVAGGLVIALLARFVLLSADTRALPVLAHGALAGFLPWLHVRFGLVGLLGAAFFVLTRRRQRRAVFTFVAAFALPVAVLAAYFYHVSGSVMPWALHALCTDEATPFRLARAFHDLPNYWFDAGGGLLAHAPFYLMAALGFWLAWRHSHLVSVGIALIVLALAVPAAGHAWVGGGTTPLRLVAAVVPLLALPLADAVARYRTSRWFTALLGFLAVVSLQNGWTYNTHLVKSEPWLLGPTAGGWLFPMLFPLGSTGSYLADLPFWVWAIATIVLLAWPIIALRSPGMVPAVPVRPMSWAGVVTVLAVAFAALASVVGGWTGQRQRTRYMADEGEVRFRLLSVAAIHPGGLVWSSSRGRESLASMFPNSADAPVSTSVAPTSLRTGQSVTASIAADPRQRDRVWGAATIDFGDRTTAVRRRFVGALTASHRFGAPGDYVVRIEVNRPGVPAVVRAEHVRVTAVDARPALPAGMLSALPADLIGRPITVSIEEARIGERSLDLRCVLAGRYQGEDVWVWLVSADQGVYRARLTLGEASAADGGSRAVRLRVAHELAANDGDLVGLVVGIGRAGRLGMAGRSDVVALPWPGPLLIKGAAVVERVPPEQR